jgi:phosphoribosylglycinamide formyltransferase-1
MPESEHAPLKLGVLISGGGSTLENLIRCIDGGTLTGTEIRLVVSSRAAVRGVEIARRAGLPLAIIRRKDYADVETFSGSITAALADARVDLVLLAGFLCFWRVPPQFEGRALNIHPALLPEFGGLGMYGGKVHRAVLAAGRHESGCTVHLVDNEYDHGPIVAQRSVPVRPDDSPETLAQRVQVAERALYPWVVQQVADHGLGWLRQFDRGS